MTSTAYDYYICKVPSRHRTKFLQALARYGTEKVIKHPYWSEMHALKSDLDSLFDEYPDLRIASSSAREGEGGES